jgi:hypothetical protein
MVLEGSALVACHLQQEKCGTTLGVNNNTGMVSCDHRWFSAVHC